MMANKPRVRNGLFWLCSVAIYMLNIVSLLFSPASLKQVDMTQKKNPFVFLDVSVDGDPVERIVIEVIRYHRDLFFA